MVTQTMTNPLRRMAGVYQPGALSTRAEKPMAPISFAGPGDAPLAASFPTFAPAASAPSWVPKSRLSDLAKPSLAETKLVGSRGVPSLMENEELAKVLASLDQSRLSERPAVKFAAPPPPFDDLTVRPLSGGEPQFSGGAPAFASRNPAGQGTRIANSGFFATRGAMIGAAVGFGSGVWLGVAAQWITGTFMLLGVLTFMGGVLGAIAGMVLALLMRD